MIYVTYTLIIKNSIIPSTKVNNLGMLNKKQTNKQYPNYIKHTRWL